MKNLIREVVKLGHAEGMVVMGYFSIAANKRWGTENPELSYGTPDGYHLPYTDEYLAYVAAAITDAVKNTGINGFMIDWIWQPNRKATEGKWLDAEKKLYQQLMGEPFPGEEKLTPAQDLEYSHRAIDRCWKTIRKAAKDANPNCIVWLTCNNIKHPHIQDSACSARWTGSWPKPATTNTSKKSAMPWVNTPASRPHGPPRGSGCIGVRARRPMWPAYASPTAQSPANFRWKKMPSSPGVQRRICYSETSGPSKQSKMAVRKNASVEKSPEVIEIDLPEAFFEGNPEAIAYEWLK